MNLAPETIPVDTLRHQRNTLLTQFDPRSFSIDENKIAGISSIHFDTAGDQFIVGDAYGKGHTWPQQGIIGPGFRSPLISYRERENTKYFTEVGYMNPSEKPLGQIYRDQSGDLDTIASKLHRPVWTEVSDLNDDGFDEILICEYGNLTGELSMLVKDGEGFNKQTLLPVPGTITLEIKDMNKDGKKDIIVLAAQGNEGIYILYQKEDLNFSTSQVIKLGPEYGSSWFETLDYNQDGLLDIVYVNGDNADYTIFSKPYHGIRLFLNTGANHFEQKWFYPIYGATRVLAEDFDLDGDYDFAVMSFFPDFKYAPEEIFVYLENTDSQEYTFNSFTLNESQSGRWLVMEKGDVDKDGDTDILLGSFILPPGRENTQILEGWLEKEVDLLFLENKAFPGDP